MYVATYTCSSYVYRAAPLGRTRADVDVDAHLELIMMPLAVERLLARVATRDRQHICTGICDFPLWPYRSSSSGAAMSLQHLRAAVTACQAPTSS